MTLGSVAFGATRRLSSEWPAFARERRLGGIELTLRRVDSVSARGQEQPYQ
jgi:hypothetical protein